MTKKELVAAMTKDAGITVANTEKLLKSLTANVTKALKKGEKVTLVGFGTFSVAKRAARTGRNPQTGKEIKIKATTVPKFKAGAVLKKTVNK